MSETSTPARGKPAASGLLSPIELLAVFVAVVSLVLLLSLTPGTTLVRDSMSTDTERWFFAPYVLLIALVVGGQRVLALIVATLIAIVGVLAGLAACSSAEFWTDRGMQGFGVVASLQILMLWACKRSAVDEARSPVAAPRLALGALAGALGWLGVTAARTHHEAPNLEALAAAQRAAQHYADGQKTRAQFLQLASCIQRSPAGTDSQPLFPASLAELAAGGDCPAAAQPAPSGFALDYRPGAADSSGARHTFTLSGHEQPVGDSSEVYSIDESFAISPSFGHGRRDAGAVTAPLGTLAELGRCVEASRDSATGRYAASVAELARATHCQLRVSSDSVGFQAADNFGRYILRYTPPPTADSARFGRYTLTMEPLRDSTGRSLGGSYLSFLVDSVGLIHVTRRPRPATVADAVLPDCVRGTRFTADRSPYCRAYRPRQRWNEGGLPTIGWSQSGNGTVASGDTLYVVAYYDGLTPTDSVVEARIAWSAGGKDSVIRRSSQGIGVADAQSVIFRLKHVYADTGNHEIHFSARTRAAEIYELRDTVRVLMRWRRPAS